MEKLKKMEKNTNRMLLVLEIYFLSLAIGCIIVLNIFVPISFPNVFAESVEIHYSKFQIKLGIFLIIECFIFTILSCYLLSMRKALKNNNKGRSEVM